MRGILSAGGYIPHGRLDRSTIAPFVGTGGGKGSRSVASYDEDTTTMGFEAARLALRAAADSSRPDMVWFSTVTPAYLDKTNATAIHAALRLDDDVAALDLGGAQRSAVGALRIALAGSDTVLMIAADMRTGLPGSADEASGGDGAAALLIGDDAAGPLLAEHIASASITAEFLDRWRAPGDARSKVWEERFGETRYVALGERAWSDALKQAELTPGDVDRVIVTSTHARAARSLVNRLGVKKEALVDDLGATVGNTGAAHPGLLLATTLEAMTRESGAPGQMIALVVLADGADVLLFRTTDATAGFRPASAVADRVASGGPVSYGKFLAWRGMLPVEPPRRPEPGRVSASASARREDWKFAFVGRRDPDTDAPQLPPLPGGTGSAAMADVPGTIAAYTVDRIAYSPSPPIVFAIVDFDGGGRFPVELTDVAESDVQVGDRVEMTFRRLFTADGIHNYFWKARPIGPAQDRQDG
jgi:3-hydroxy-3-methylglutaryl CoA synthase